MAEFTELRAALAKILPPDGRFRLSCRGPHMGMVSREGRDGIDSLWEQASAEGYSELRVEHAPAEGEFQTIFPWARFGPQLPTDPIVVRGPGDRRGYPVRIMVRDEAAGAYILDYAEVGGAFVLDAAVLPLSHLLRYRFYRWLPETGGWAPAGPARRLPRSGPLAELEPAPLPGAAVAAVAARVAALMPPGARDGEALVEIYDQNAPLADAPAHADAARELLAALEEVCARVPVSELRFRLTSQTLDGSQVSTVLQTVADPDVAFDALARLMRGDRSKEGDVDLLFLYSGRDDGPRLGACASAYLFRVLPEGVCIDPQGWTLAGAEELFQRWRAMERGSEIVGEVLNYTRLYATLREEAVARKAWQGHWFDPAALRVAAPSVLERAAALPGFDPGLYSSMAFTAKVESVLSRGSAAGLAAQALASTSPLRPAASMDGGFETFFDAGRLEEQRGLIEARRRELMSSLDTLGAPAAQGRRPVLLFSCDVRFLAIYFPHWLAIAEYCKTREVEFHFVIAGEKGIVDQALDRIEALWLALARLRGGELATYADNLTVSTWPLPSWCGSPETFYACARYLAAGELTRRFGRDMLVQDIDFLLLQDPKPFLDHFPKPGIGVQPASLLYGLEPWRRFMGGTFYAPNSDPVRAALRHLEDYIIAGLPSAASWYLDQNALAYLVERVSEAGTPALWPLTMERPTQQPRVNKLFEAAQPPLPPAAG